MRKLYTILLTVIAVSIASCEPEVYTGPLDSPIGSWDGIRSDYYFNGEMIAALDSCETTAISFYKQGLCCIEGVKGAFPFIYDDAHSLLQIDSTLWAVEKLMGTEMVLSYLYRILPQPAEPAAHLKATLMNETDTPEGSEDLEQPEDTEEPVEPEEPTEPENPEEPMEPEEPAEPEEPVIKPDANGFILPIEYRGVTINADKYGYYYINRTESVVYCNFKGWKNADKTWTVDFWYDAHTDYFIPLVVDTTKK